MEKVVDALREWLAQHGLPQDGVKLQIIMPNQSFGFGAWKALNMDLGKAAPSPGDLAKLKGVSIGVGP
jgi:hypothetical protein